MSDFSLRRGILHRQFLGEKGGAQKITPGGILHRQFLGHRYKSATVTAGGILHRQFLGYMI